MEIKLSHLPPGKRFKLLSDGNMYKKISHDKRSGSSYCMHESTGKRFDVSNDYNIKPVLNKLSPDAEYAFYFDQFKTPPTSMMAGFMLASAMNKKYEK